MVFLTLDLFFGGMWFLSPYSRSESAHPRLMESDDVVCFSRLVVLALSFLCMSELDRAGASLNAISLSHSHHHHKIITMTIIRVVVALGTGDCFIVLDSVAAGWHTDLSRGVKSNSAISPQPSTGWILEVQGG